MSTLDRAIFIATWAHTGQVDLAGEPFVLHPLRVMQKVATTQERIVAVLHDVVSECPGWTLRHLAEEGFSEPVLSALDLLTQRESEDFRTYISQVRVDPMARTVKVADLLDQLDSTRAAALDRTRRKELDRALWVLFGTR
jgi:(p)ppGpp synthase/HD superfamily hydrolase